MRETNLKKANIAKVKKANIANIASSIRRVKITKNCSKNCYIVSPIKY